jgi:hypothetical protein
VIRRSGRSVRSAGGGALGWCVAIDRLSTVRGGARGPHRWVARPIAVCCRSTFRGYRLLRLPPPAPRRLARVASPVARGIGMGAAGLTGPYSVSLPFLCPCGRRAGALSPVATGAIRASPGDRWFSPGLTAWPAVLSNYPKGRADIELCQVVIRRKSPGQSGCGKNHGTNLPRCVPSCRPKGHGADLGFCGPLTRMCVPPMSQGEGPARSWKTTLIVMEPLPKRDRHDHEKAPDHGADLGLCLNRRRRRVVTGARTVWLYGRRRARCYRPVVIKL